MAASTKNIGTAIILFRKTPRCELLRCQKVDSLSMIE